MMKTFSARGGLIAAAGIAAIVISGVCFGVPGMCSGKEVFPLAKTAKHIEWRPSLPSAIEEATRTGKPIMVDFHATWCPPCKMLDSQTYSDATVIAEADRWVSVKVDVDKEAETAARYNVSSLPTIAFLKPDGTAIASVNGFVPAGQMNAALRDAHARALSKPEESSGATAVSPEK